MAIRVQDLSDDELRRQRDQLNFEIGITSDDMSERGRDAYRSALEQMEEVLDERNRRYERGRRQDG